MILWVLSKKKKKDTLLNEKEPVDTNIQRINVRDKLKYDV